MVFCWSLEAESSDKETIGGRRDFERLWSSLTFEEQEEEAGF